MCKFVARTDPITIQVHDGLALTVEGVRVIEDSGDRMQLIFGTDIFDPTGRVVRERRTEMRNGRKVIDLEVGESGITYELVTNSGRVGDT